jgi:hypothetical protein
MVKELECEWEYSCEESCADCIYLDKERKHKAKYRKYYIYGCNSENVDAYVHGWITNDNELKTIGCVHCNILTVGTRFVHTGKNGLSTNYMYCGAYRTKSGKMLRLVRHDECQGCVVMPEDWIRKNKKEIKVVFQNKAQFKESKRIARQMKENLLKYCELIKWKE